MTRCVADPVAWQESWDRQQEAYLPDREDRFRVMLDAVEAVAGCTPRILDLAAGTGSISLRALRRFPAATPTVLDIDPVLLAIARASVGDRATVVDADLRAPGWVDALPHRDFDAVLTATALHWLPLDRLAAVYAEVRTVLRPGGLFINVDHAPDDGLPGLTGKLDAAAASRRRSRQTAGAVLSWQAWWQHVASDPALGPLVADRRRAFGDGEPAESQPPLSWHLDALRAAGYAEAGLIWRGAADAAITGVA
jgi:SAM-dependent methyltransferase